MTDATFECVICKDFYSDAVGDYFVSTKKGHVFHALCIKQLILIGRRNCPLCREILHPSTLIRLCGVDPRRTDYVFKIIVLGDSTVGKTCLLRRFTDESFDENTCTTIGIDTRRKILDVGGERIQLNIWDTAGQELHKAITKQYVRKAQGVILLYDVTKPKSLENTQNWLEFANENGSQEAIKILVGNKNDLMDKRLIEFEDGEMFADKLGVHFIETSAKNAYNVAVAFRTLAAKILENRWLLKEAREEASKLHFPERLSEEEQKSCCPSFMN